jgi:toxin CcdB
VAQFDVFRSRDGSFVIDCQSELLRHLESRFVVPLMPLDRAPKPAGRLNPLFQIEGRELSMMTQFAGSIDSDELGAFVCSLPERRYEITGALDMLIGGV